MRRKTKKRRGSSRYFILFFFIIVVMYGIWFGVNQALQRVTLFTVKNIEIKGNRNLDVTFLKNLAKEFIGKNQFEISHSDIRIKYENIVRVKNVKIRKKLPDTIVITITERLGILYIKTAEGEFFPIDNEKVVLDKADFYFSEDLPVASLGITKAGIRIGEKINDPNLNRIMNLYAKILKIDPAFIANISEFYIADNEIYFVDSQNGCRVILGDVQLEKKIERFLFLRSNKGFERNKIIDLRYKDQLIER